MNWAPSSRLLVGTAVMLALVVLGSCGSTGSTGSSSPRASSFDLTGQWVLVSMGTSSDRSAVSTERRTTITFGDDEAHGAAPCNRYRAPYTLDGERFEIGPIAATKALCGDPELDVQEALYLSALEASSTASLNEDGDLTIAYGDGGRLHYRRA